MSNSQVNYLRFLQIFDRIITSQLYRDALDFIKQNPPDKIKQIEAANADKIKAIRIKAENDLSEFVAVLQKEPFELVVPIIDKIETARKYIQIGICRKNPTDEDIIALAFGRSSFVIGL